MNSEQLGEGVSLKTCMICERIQAPDRKMKATFSEQEVLCSQCYDEQNLKIQQYKHSRNRFYPQLDEIEKGLWLGNEDAAADLEIIEKHQIRAICVCGKCLETPFAEQVFKQKFPQINYIKHDIDDYPTQKIIHLFDQNNRWIEKALQEGRNVLVHCAAGVSRSASFVIAYLMGIRGLSYEQAYLHVKSKRPIIHPNSGFQQQLQEYQKILKERHQKAQSQQVK